MYNFDTMPVFRVYFGNGIFGWNSYEPDNEDGFLTDVDSLEEEDSDIEYEEITIIRVTRRHRKFEDILALILDEAIDEFEIDKCAAAA